MFLFHFFVNWLFHLQLIRDSFFFTYYSQANNEGKLVESLIAYYLL